MTPLLLLALAATPPDRPALEHAVRARFEAVGRSAPNFDAELNLAANELASRALAAGVEDAAGLLRVTAAISRHGGWDANPVVVAVRASNQVLVEELKKQDLTSEPATQVGLGLATGTERSAVIVLLARRRAELERFRRAYEGPVGAQPLCLRLISELTSAELFVTRPHGTVERSALQKSTGENPRLCGGVAFAEKGRHTVEVLATGPRGPEVVALFFVDVGEVKADAADAMLEPETDADARAELLVRINALRLQHGVTPLVADAALEVVAQAWAERLGRENFFSHVAPDGSTLRQRLTESGYVFQSAGENLGLSTGPLAAHFGIEHSPGHRRNLLDAGHRRAGFGLAVTGDGRHVLVELFARPKEEEKNPLAAIYASIDAERDRRKLPRLQRSRTLEQLATAHAAAALQQDLPRARLPGLAPLQDRAFEALPDLGAVAVDLFVADTPKVGGESKNLGELKNRVVGVGVAKGDSARYGKGRYWIVVIYGVPLAP